MQGRPPPPACAARPPAPHSGTQIGLVLPSLASSLPNSHTSWAPQRLCSDASRLTHLPCIAPADHPAGLQKYRICGDCMMAPQVQKDGLAQRFCQQVGAANSAQRRLSQGAQSAGQLVWLGTRHPSSARPLTRGAVPAGIAGTSLFVLLLRCGGALSGGPGGWTAIASMPAPLCAAPCTHRRPDTACRCSPDTACLPLLPASGCLALLQCSRFHDLESFDAGMRSCRAQLAMHATRRRLRRSGAQRRVTSR